MSTKRTKRREPAIEEEDDVVAIDRISKLPDCVIHHILSFVPTVDAVRTSLVSRRWRRMWHSVPVLQFPDRVGFDRREEGFNVFVEMCLMHRRRALRFLDGSAVTTFELTAHYTPILLASLNKWFGSKVVMNNVKDLVLCLFPQNSSQNPYNLPRAVLNGRSLTHLHLEGCLEIRASCSVHLPSLVSLSLSHVQLDEDFLNDLFTGCPSLEKCVVFDNSCVFGLAISSLSLRFLDIEADIESANINASNLEFLRLMDICGPGLDISDCKAIRDLTISDISNLESKKFEDQISKLPNLDTLTLYMSRGEQLKISSKSLKHLFLHKYEKQELDVATDTPNLVSFNYMGEIDVKMSTGLLYHGVKGRFDVSGSSSELINFLSNINPTWNSFNLCCFIEDEGIILNKNMCEISLTSGSFKEHSMTVRFSCKCTQKADFTHFLKQLAPFA